jgi:polysaccharide pyruvyl transferase WcaK-like protein
MKKRLAVFGCFGAGNFGNDATLQTVLYHVRRLLPEHEVTCICIGPETVAAKYSVAAMPIRAAARRQSPRNPVLRLAKKFLLVIPREISRWFRGLRMLWGTDALVVPGTGLLTDAYTLLNWGPYDMFRWSVTAKLCGCKLLFVSVGVGPLYTSIGRFLVKSALSLADFRSYRDDASLQYLKRIDFRVENDGVYPDLVFSLHKGLIPRGYQSKRPRLVVGLGLMEYAGKYSAERPSDAIYTEYLQALVDFVKWLLAHEYEVRLLVGDPVDTHVVREFRSLLKERLAAHEEERIIDEPITSVEDLLRQLAATDLVVATRFHNVLLSLLLNKPVIAISFHHKCSSLMGQMGLSEYCQDINSLDTDRLIEQFCQLEQHADSVKRTIREKVDACQDALDEQYNIIVSHIYPPKQPLAVPATEIQHSRPSTNPS